MAQQIGRYPTLENICQRFFGKYGKDPLPRNRNALINSEE
jgi:hypothetical protein